MTDFTETLQFWLIASGMVGLALAFVIPRLLTSRDRTTGTRRSTLNAAVCRDALCGLDRERAEGRLSDEEWKFAREDAQRRLIADASDEAIGSAGPLPSRKLALAACFALPALAVGLYVIFGDPSALQRTAPLASAAIGAGSAIAVPRDQLALHLARNPKDGRAWVLLARIDFEADRFGDAAASYRKALAASPKIAADPGLWCEFADALGMAQGGTLEGEPRELIHRALALDPTHPKALELAGSAAFEQRDYATAARHWRRLLAALPAGTRSHRELAAAVAEAEGRAGVSVASREATR